MTASSILTSLAASLGHLAMPNAPASAKEFTANAFSRERCTSPEATNENPAARVPALSPIVGTQRAGERLPCSCALPEGYVPVREAKHLALLGRWQPLDDKLPACLPMKLLLAMQRRCENGDPDATAWLRVYDRAFSGEADAQREFGWICEIGAYRAPADLQRAFFWYYRAALQGDIEARYGAERIGRSTTVSPIVLAEPELVYRGSWRIKAGMPGGGNSTSYFELAENGAAAGCLIGSNGAAAGSMNNTLNAFCGSYAPSLLTAPMQNAQYQGRWAYHHSSRTLAFEFPAPVAGARGKWSDAWQIELLGCRRGALYGRDRRTVAYTLEYIAARGDAQHAKRVAAGRQS